jgi:hypothetical protein
MIGNKNERRSDVVPGRLKIVTIGPRVTVAFAGEADPADVAIREARVRLLENGFDAAIDALRDDSRSRPTDYIVAAHLERLMLIRIRNGAALEILDICAIGDVVPFQELIAHHLNVPPTGSIAKCDLRFSFVDRLMTGRNLGNTIGGFPVAAFATPEQHRYVHHTGTYTYDLRQIGPGETVEQSIADVYTGRNYFQLSMVPSSRPDVPVVGACLLQACTGWVYSPIQDIRPFKIALAPAGTEWEGRHQEMFAKLQAAIEEHVDALRSG